MKLVFKKITDTVAHDTCPIGTILTCVTNKFDADAFDFYRNGGYLYQVCISSEQLKETMDKYGYIIIDEPKRKEIKSEVDWLDNIQLNFKEG